MRNGVRSRVWQKTRARSEALDVRMYALAAFVNLNVNLDHLAKSLKARSVNESKPNEPPKKDPMQGITKYVINKKWNLRLEPPIIFTTGYPR